MLAGRRLVIAKALFLTSSLVALQSVAGSEFGELTGRVVFDGAIPQRQWLVRKGDATAKDAEVCAAKGVPDESLVINGKNRGIQHVFVYLPRGLKRGKVHPDLVETPSSEVTFDKRDCRFVPHSLVVRTRQELRIRSFDSCAHNTHPYPLLNPAPSFVVEPQNRQGRVVTFANREFLPIQVRCDIHPWMKAWWLMVDHPYAAVTDANGRFRISKLPAGRHVFTIWHEQIGYIEKELTVEIADGDTTDLKEIAVPSERFQGRSR